jgi:hypothetical protein
MTADINSQTHWPTPDRDGALLRGSTMFARMQKTPAGFSPPGKLGRKCLDARQREMLNQRIATYSCLFDCDDWVCLTGCLADLSCSEIER